MIVGKRPVMEALQAGTPIHKLFVLQGIRGLEEIITLAQQQGVFVQKVDNTQFQHMARDVRHQGVIAIVAAESYVSLEQLVQNAWSQTRSPLLVVLDGIEDPHNLGSVLRTVDCAGGQGVIVPQRRAAGLTATVARTSAGASAYVPVARVTNIARTVEQLKELGFWTMGAVVGDDIDSMYAIDMTVPLAVVIGNEAKGLTRLVRERCDLLVRIPMVGHIQSLNASVATAVLLYEAMRQRRETTVS